MATDSLTQDLALSIQKYLEGNKRRSLSGLAKRSGIAYSTIRRIANQETHATSQSTLAIIDITLEINEKILFLKKHFPQIGDLMAAGYHQSVTKPKSQETLREFLRREPHNRIFNIAATKQGITKSQVRQLAGKIGIEAVEEMLTKEVLITDQNNVIRYHQPNWALGNIEDALHQVKQSTQYFGKALIGTDGANLMHATGAIKKDSLPELKKLITKFIHDVQRFKNDPANEGGLHFFCDLLYSLYDIHELD